MSVEVYKKIQTSTESKEQLSRRIVRSIISYIKEYQSGIHNEVKRKESLLNAQTVCLGALFSLEQEPNTQASITMRNVLDMCNFNIRQELIGENESNLTQIVDLMNMML